MRRVLLLPVLLSGCLFHSTGAPAPAGALACAQQAAVGMGYRITAQSEQASFRAEKTVADPGGLYDVVEEITAEFWGDPQRGARLRVDGSRFEQRRGSGSPRPAVIPGVGGQPGTPPATARPGIPAGGVQVGGGSRAAGSRRISPGTAGVNAQAIQDQCAASARGRMARGG